jgi:hypothetical protein
LTLKMLKFPSLIWHNQFYILMLLEFSMFWMTRWVRCFKDLRGEQFWLFQKCSDSYNMISSIVITNSTEPVAVHCLQNHPDIIIMLI